MPVNIYEQMRDGFLEEGATNKYIGYNGAGEFGLHDLGAGSLPAAQAANTVLAGPPEGPPYAPAFRELAPADIPNLFQLVPLATLVSTGWTLVGDYYEYDWTAPPGVTITANTFPWIFPLNATLDIVIAAQMAAEVLVTAGHIKFYATNAPTGDISVSMLTVEVVPVSPG